MKLESTVNRRKFIVASAAAVATAALSRSVLAGDQLPQLSGGMSLSAGRLDHILEATKNCIAAGNLCVAHCMTEFDNGNTEMAECNRTVHQMLAFCESMNKLASYGASLTRQMAAICAKACQECAKACEQHRAHWGHGMHLACKACFEACNECVQACENI